MYHSCHEGQHWLYKPKRIFVPGCKSFFSAVKFATLTWGVYRIDSLLESVSSGQAMNCILSHFCVGFKRETAWIRTSFSGMEPIASVASAPQEQRSEVYLHGS